MAEIENLIKQCKKGDSRAQRALFDIYKRKWMGICVRYIKDADESKDAFQEGAIKIFEGINSLNTIEAFEGWARRIMINHSLNHIRKKKIYVMVLKEYTEDADVSPVDMDALDKMSQQEVLNLINQIPEGYRIVLNLALVDGYKHAEIAEMLSINESTSRSQLNKARKFLQRLIEDQKIKEDARIAG